MRWAAARTEDCSHELTAHTLSALTAIVWMRGPAACWLHQSCALMGDWDLSCGFTQCEKIDGTDQQWHNAAGSCPGCALLLACSRGERRQLETQAAAVPDWQGSATGNCKGEQWAERCHGELHIKACAVPPPLGTLLHNERHRAAPCELQFQAVSSLHQQMGRLAGVVAFRIAATHHHLLETLPCLLQQERGAAGSVSIKSSEEQGQAAEELSTRPDSGGGQATDQAALHGQQHHQQPHSGKSQAAADAAIPPREDSSWLSWPSNEAATDAQKSASPAASASGSSKLAVEGSTGAAEVGRHPAEPGAASLECGMSWEELSSGRPEPAADVSARADELDAATSTPSAGVEHQAELEIAPADSAAGLGWEELSVGEADDAVSTADSGASDEQQQPQLRQPGSLDDGPAAGEGCIGLPATQQADKPVADNASSAAVGSQGVCEQPAQHLMWSGSADSSLAGGQAEGFAPQQAGGHALQLGSAEEVAGRQNAGGPLPGLQEASAVEQDLEQRAGGQAGAPG